MFGSMLWPRHCSPKYGFAAFHTSASMLMTEKSFVKDSIEMSAHGKLFHQIS